MNLLRCMTCIALVALSTAALADPPPIDQPVWNLEALSAPPSFRWADEASPIRSLFYAGEAYRGEPTEVFAFYASPATIGEAKAGAKFPAVVLVHGGGGTAFAEWAWLWAKRGYAAIAMDLSGRRPPAPQFDPTTHALIPEPDHRKLAGSRIEHPGPEQGHEEKFASVGGEVDDDWPLHAVANAIRAHSLVRSFPEVDAERTAVTGISWGGYTTCIVASIDHRFKAAVPVYGCGHLYDGESVQRPQIDSLDAARRDEWIRRYDPSSHLAKCTVPTFWVNGTNDPHYPLESYAKCYDLVMGPKEFRIEVNMPHSHPAGWAPKEIGLYIDQQLRGGDPLPKLGKPRVEGEQAIVNCTTRGPAQKAEIHYTTDAGPQVERKWMTMPAELVAATDTSAAVGDSRDVHYTVRAAAPPAEAKAWLMSVTDSRGAMVSSEVVFGSGK